jgi:ribosomal protein S6--L-glutamate ligase
LLVGILTFRNHRYHPNRRLTEAARARGHRLVLLHPAKVYLSASGEGLRIGHLGKPCSPDVVLPRIGSTIREFPLTLVRQMENTGVRMVNGFEAVTLARNKFRTLQALVGSGIPVPESRYAGNERNLAAAVRDLGSMPIVIKTAQGRQGRGVFLAENRQHVWRLFKAHPPELGGGMVLQEFIPPEERRRDLRLLVVGGRVVSAMALSPRRGEFRANVHLRGRSRTLRLTEEMERIALGAAEALGLDIAGVDVIHKKDNTLLVVDVNYSPGFKGLEGCTGDDVADRIIAFATSSKEG